VGILGCIGSWLVNGRQRDHWGDLGVVGWIILGWIFGVSVFRDFVLKPEGKSPLGGTMRRWVDNIKMDVWEDVGV